jgi:tripartite-type tricarboxylate transporter receptor subunit TctC
VVLSRVAGNARHEIPTPHTLATGSGCCCAPGGIAQAYPTRPVRIIVGFAAGGGADITARLMGQSLSERLGQQFIVENRPGAGGNIATEAVVNAPADGYTLLLATSPNAVNATLYQKLNFNFIRDISPVASVVAVPNVVVIHPSVPATTVPEFIAYARANPGKLNMGSGGIGAAVQDDDRRQHGPRAVSRRCSRRC